LDLTSAECRAIEARVLKTMPYASGWGLLLLPGSRDGRDGHRGIGQTIVQMFMS